MLHFILFHNHRKVNRRQEKQNGHPLRRYLQKIWKGIATWPQGLPQGIWTKYYSRSRGWRNNFTKSFTKSKTEHNSMESVRSSRSKPPPNFISSSSWFSTTTTTLQMDKRVGVQNDFNDILIIHCVRLTFPVHPLVSTDSTRPKSQPSVSHSFASSSNSSAGRSGRSLIRLEPAEILMNEYVFCCLLTLFKVLL